ncbi:MAG: hypothetical protein LBK64_00085 [Spirochaetaceae bacterium]|jgi:hypothetical protein|nr:hypothetical protein [Spirochaetaceae bacterium]
MRTPGLKPFPKPAGFWKWLIIDLFFVFVPAFSPAEPLHSPTWGFYLDLPEGYSYESGDGRDRFSFVSDNGGIIDIVVYGPGVFESPEALAGDIRNRLNSRGDISPYIYHDKKAAIAELHISRPGGALSGWALCTELASRGSGPPPLLAALAYGPASRQDLPLFYLSALDSIVPSEAEKYSPGPITEFSYPRGEIVPAVLANRDLKALIGENDAEAAGALVDREFAVLSAYLNSPLWKEAWIRFYRVLFKDAYERLADLAFVFERDWYARYIQNPSSGGRNNDESEARAFAQDALKWVQGFVYERDATGSDFVDLVSAATQGRGDCDSRALLWALILARNNIPAAIMVSPEYGHAMGLAQVQGPGAVFELGGRNWIVAETTVDVDLGLIGESVSDPRYWIGIDLVR